MESSFDLADRLQARIALMAIGASTLRNQGAPGVVAAARRYLRQLDLGEFSVSTESAFQEVLGKHTRLLMNCFPGKAKGNWGAARKGLNIFLRDVVYNRSLSDHHLLWRLEPWLELPLDSNAYEGLCQDVKHLLGHAAICEVPPWNGVKYLDAGVSGDLQGIANRIAEALNTHRVHLDVRYWRRVTIDRLQV
jgi:hypothetical protein